MNILVYGYGSKFTLLNDFAKTNFMEYPKLIIEGFSSKISIKQILDKLYQILLELNDKVGNDDKDENGDPINFANKHKPK